MVKRLLRDALLAPVALVLLFEEWGWAPLAQLFTRLARLPVWACLERWVVGLPPYGALLVFTLPMLTLMPVKLLALYLFGQGKTKLGLSLLVGAKLLGTAVVARLFHLTQPGLMQLAWFAHWHPRWKTWKDDLLQQVHQSAPWRLAREIKVQAKVWWASVRALGSTTQT